MILVDTGGIVANYDRGDRHHAEVVRVLARPERRILSPFVLAEADYLLSELSGPAAELTLLEDDARGAFELASFDAADVVAALAIIRRYADMDLRLADASIVVLAGRLGCRDVLTLDQRHFRAVRDPGGTALRLLPLDDPDR